MNKADRHVLTRSTRRDFAKIFGLGVARTALGSSTMARPENLDADELAKLATEGSPVHLAQTEIAELKKDIQDGQKGLKKIRDFQVRADVEPAVVFRTRR